MSSASAHSASREPVERFEDRALAGNGGVVARSGAPFPFNKIMPYDSTGGEKLYRAYQQSAWVQRAIKKIAGPIAAVRLDFTLNDEAFDDPDLELYWTHPALRLSFHDFIEASVGWLKLEGEVFWLMDDNALVPFKSRDTFPQLIVARPDRMFLKHHQGAVLGWDYVDSYGTHHPLLPEQVIHIRAWNPYDEFRGLAEMHAAKDAAEADFFAGKYAKNQFANNGDRGPYIIAEEGIPTDEQRQQIIDQLREKRELAQRGVYKPIFLTGKIRIEDAKAQAPDATFISARLENRHEIALAFGVPPSMFDVKASFSIGSASDYYMLIAETCIPTSKKLAHGIGAVAQIMTGKPLKADFNWDEHPVIQTVRRERAETGSKMFAMGVPLKTINDWLDLKLPKCPDWETGYVASTLVPVGTPPPDKNPDFAETGGEPAESALDKMKQLLNPIERMKSVIAAPAQPRFHDDSCACRAVESGLKCRTTNARELALWRTLQAQRTGTRNSIQAKIGKVLMEARAEVKSNIERAAVKAPALSLSKGTQTKAVAADFMFDLGQFSNKLFAAVRPVMESALNQSGQDLYSEIGLDDPWKYPSHEALQFLKSRENRMAGVADEVWNSVRDTIHDSLVEGDSIKDMQDAVSGKFNQISKGRAKTVAITETGICFESGRDAAMKSAGIRWKQWLTSGNANVRPAHEDAEGQIVAMTESFEVGGEKLRFPCDPEGSAENIINCHCVSIPNADGPDESDES